MTRTEATEPPSSPPQAPPLPSQDSQEARNHQPSPAASDASAANSHSVWLETCHTNPGAYSFYDAVSEALRFDSTTQPHARSLFLPFRSHDIREKTMWFLKEHGKTKMAPFFGLSFAQQFRTSPPSLSFHHLADPHTPETWDEYCQLQSDDRTFVDKLFVMAVATAYQCQIVIFAEDGESTTFSPNPAFRRIFLFASTDFKHFNYGTPLSDEEGSARGNDTVWQWHFNAFPLQPDAAPLRSSLSSALDISEDKLAAIHRAHNAYSGHPGVQATVRILKGAGTVWRHMTAHVTQFIKRCPTCCSSRSRLLQAPVSAACLRLQAKPLSRWHIDSTGDMGTCDYSGFSKMIAFICEATQFCVLFGSRYGTALETALALIQLMGWLGLPEAIHSDGGSENDNYIWHQVQQITGIKHTLSIPHVPQSNGIAERNIGSAKRFLRALTVDIGRINSWGLLLPIAQHGMNSLKREDLLWYSPNDIVFANLLDRNEFIIPTFYSRAVRELDVSNANGYVLSANLAHRAVCFQHMIVNAHHDILDRAFDKATGADPTALSDLSLGQAVLIDWHQQPTPLHPQKRGPYRVVDIHDNSVTLEHFSSPPPDQQPATITWSKHAHVYAYEVDEVPTRSPLDPSASHMPSDIPGRNIDCVIAHHPKSASQSQREQLDVRHQVYECRLYSTATKPADMHSMIRIFEYDQIKHTHAFDVYCQAVRQLSGHTPVAFMPDSWNPLAVTPARRPAFPPTPFHETLFREEISDCP